MREENSKWNQMAEFFETTADNLKFLRGAQGMNQAQIAKVLGISGNAVSKIELGLRDLTAAEKKILDLYFFGKLPDGILRPSEEIGHTLDLTEQEWQIIEILALRAGQTPAQWIRTKILDYLAYSAESRTQSEEQQDGGNITPMPIAAEEPGKYHTRKPLAAGKKNAPISGPPSSGKKGTG